MRRVVAAAAQFRFGFWLAGSAASGGTTGLTALSIDWAPAAGWCARSTVVRMQTCASDHKRLGRCASRILTGSARLGSARLGSARLGSARLGSARLGSARLGSARLGSARLGSARLGSARLGSARLGMIMGRNATPFVNPMNSFSSTAAMTGRAPSPNLR